MGKYLRTDSGALFHRVIYFKNNPNEKKHKNWHVHHCDCNKLNNDISNLVHIPEIFHNWIHRHYGYQSKGKLPSKEVIEAAFEPYRNNWDNNHIGAVRARLKQLINNRRICKKLGLMVTEGNGKQKSPFVPAKKKKTKPLTPQQKEKAKKKKERRQRAIKKRQREEAEFLAETEQIMAAPKPKRSPISIKAQVETIGEIIKKRESLCVKLDKEIAKTEKAISKKKANAKPKAKLKKLMSFKEARMEKEAKRRYRARRGSSALDEIRALRENSQKIK